jgi:hypothetical protein
MTDSRSLDGESHWEVARTGWSSAGWSEADPSPEEAMAALASMRPTGPGRRPAYLDNPKAVGARPNARWGYLPCGCKNDGFGNHAGYAR